MNFKLIYLLLISFVFSTTALGSICDNSTAHTITRPISSKDPSRGTFQYKFGFQKRDNPDATVLIFLPGGPGQTSMDLPLSLPNSFAVVRTDPRGVGCNRGEFPVESFTSEELAKDIIAIIKELKPKRYILHGISYGTVVATIAAAIAEKENVPQPSAVVLEGTMGKMYRTGEYSDGYISSWEKLVKELPPSVLELFNNPELPLGYTSLEWAAWISSMSIYGLTPAGKNLLKEALLLLEPGRDPSHHRSLRAQLNRSRVLPSEDRLDLYREIICRELVPDIRDIKYDFDLQEGRLLLRDTRFCKGIPVSRPYDSAIYQISAPIYYFSGELDPATPVSQATYHFSNQRTSGKYMIRLPLGGHQALSFNLFDCAQDIWLSIEYGTTEDLKSVLNSCKHSTQLIQGLSLENEVLQ